MSYFRKPGAGLDERHDTAEPDELLQYGGDDAPPSPRATFGEVAGRVSRWFQGLDDEPDGGATAEWDPMSELGGEDEDEPAAPRWSTTARDGVGSRLRSDGDSDSDEVAPRFPLAPFGYNRAAVDEQLAELERRLVGRERELTQLREAEKPPMSITEEIERLGEQTASILVVAHDQAHETTRRAQEQAERCVADAAANAIEITAEAKNRLRELDDETDSVWRERQRLLEDTRAVSSRLASLVDEAEGRFPADAGGDRGTLDSSAVH
jgi:DivIVA protein